MRRGLRRRAAPRAARRLRPGAHLPPRQREVASDELRAGARRRASATSCSTALDEIERLERRRRARRAPARADARHAGRRGRARTTTSRPARPTRSSASTLEDAGAAIDARARLRRARARRACTCTSARRSSSSTPSARRSRRSRRSATSGTYNLGGGLGVAYTAADAPPTIEEYVDAKVERGARAARRRQAAAARAGPRARRERDGDALHRRVGQAQTSRPGSPSTAGCRTTCARCSTAPSTRRRSPTASAAARLPRRRQALRVRRRHRRATSPLDDPRPGDVLVTPATGAYGHAMANNYNGVPRPPVIFCKDGDARVVVRRETYEDLHGRDDRLTPFRVGLLGHGTVGGGVRARCSRSAPDAIAAVTGPAGPRSPAC